MRELISTCKNCGKEFMYSVPAIQISLENGESEPLRCDDCRRTHSKEMRNFPNAFLPVSAKLRSKFLSLYNLGTYREKKEKIAQENSGSTKGMQFGITDMHLQELYKKLQTNRVVVLVSGTGSGKSTLVPARLLHPPEGEAEKFLQNLSRQGRIAITEPRIAAVHRVAHAIGKIAGSKVGPGFLMGFRHGSRKGNRKEGEQWNRYNQLVIVTDGSLRNWIQSGEIRKYSLIIIDEAHERNKNIDVIFGLLKRALLSHPHLKIIIASATINEEQFVKTFEELGVSVHLLKIESYKKASYLGPHFWKSTNNIPKCDCWLCKLSTEKRQEFWNMLPDQVYEDSLAENIAELTTAIVTYTQEGSIIIFLQGQYEIEKTQEILQKRLRGKLPVLTLFSNLGEKEVEKRLKKTEEKRAILLSTNIAQTSLTILNLRYVIDSGFIKENHWNSSAQTEELKTKYCSKDDCRQRWGRVGRTEKGYVFTLYTESQFNDDEIFIPHPIPAIIRERLDDVTVTAASAGIDDIKLFPWIDPPDKKVLKTTIETVQKLAMIDSSGDITERGIFLSKIPLSTQVVSLANAACQTGCFTEAFLILSLSFTRDGACRFGELLYDKENGLLVWDSRWDAGKKAKVHFIHRSLRIGCQDDIDFVIKLFRCFLEQRDRNTSEVWAEQYFLNHFALNYAYKDFKEFHENIYGKDAHDSQRDFDYTRLSLVRKLLRAHVPDASLNIIAEKNERYITNEALLDQLLPVGTTLIVEDIDDKTFIKSPLDEKSLIRCNWTGYEHTKNPYLLEWMDFSGEPCARICAFSENELSEKLTQKFKNKATIKIKSILRDAYGPEGVVIFETDDGLQFPSTLSSLSLSWAGYGLEATIGKTVTLDVTGLGVNKYPFLSNTRQIADDFDKLFGEGQTVSYDGWIEKVDIDRQNITAIMRRADTIIHGFEIFRWKAIPYGKVNNIKKGEKIVLELTKKGTPCYISIELSPKDISSLPKEFSYDKDEGRLFFPSCLKYDHLEKKCFLPSHIKEEILRISWLRGLEVEILSFKERLNKMSERDMVNGKIMRSVYEKEKSNSLKGYRIALPDGIPAFAPADAIPTHKANEGNTIKFIIEKINPDTGFIRLISGDMMKVKLKKELEYLEDEIIIKSGKLMRAQSVLADNRKQKASARSIEHRLRVEGWIKDQETRITNLEYQMSQIRSRYQSIRDTITKLEL